MKLGGRVRLLLTLPFLASCFGEPSTVAGSDGPSTSMETGDDTEDCRVGSEGCPCTVGGGCDVGLTCLSNTCVDTSVESTGPADEGGTTESSCGNGTLDDGEECDGGAGCEECELAHYDCNPLNQAGCASTMTCDRTRGGTLADQRTGCFQKGQAGYGDDCTYNPIDPARQCSDGLSCVGSAFVPGCEGLAECCTQFCIIGDDTCPDPTMQCLTWKEPGMPPGLDDLGLCIRL